jgi:hypothetical protein
MEDTEFSPEFCAFVKKAIASIDAAELLVLLHSNPDNAFAAQEAAGKMGRGLNAHEVSKCLATFAANGLVSDEGGRYRYRAGAAHGAFVQTLAQAYRERPVTLVRIIYALRDSSIQSFSEAFRLKRNPQ